LVLSVKILMKYSLSECVMVLNAVDCSGNRFSRATDCPILSESSVDSHNSVYRSFAAIDIGMLASIFPLMAMTILLQQHMIPVKMGYNA